MMTLWSPGIVDLSASAAAQASDRRGFVLAASAEAEAEVSAAIGEAAGSVTASASADAGAVLRAAFPLDLWRVCGLVVEASLGGRARAAIAATGQLSLDELRDAVTERLPAPLRGAPLTAFLSETSIEAGGFAEIALSAEAHARLVFAGALFPPVGEPGFTLSCGAGYGIGVGGGYDTAVRVRVGNAVALVRGTLEPLFDDLVGTLRKTDQHEAAQAASIVLPAALDVALSAPVLRAGEEDAFLEAFVESVRSRLLPVVTQEAVRLALGWFAEQLSDVEAPEDVGTGLAAARVALDQAHAAVDALDPASDPADQLRACARVLDAAREVIAPAGVNALASEALRATAAAVAVAVRALDDRPLDTVLPTGLLALLPDEGRNGRSLADLVSVEIGPLLTQGPEWLAKLAGADQDRLLGMLLSAQASETLFLDHSAVVEAAASLVENTLLPHVDGVVSSEMCDVLVRPLGAVVTDVLRGIAIADHEAATVAREKVSALLIASLGPFLLNTCDVCAQRALETAGEAIDGLIAELESRPNDERARQTTSLVLLAASVGMRLALNAPNIAALLRFSKSLVAAAERIREPCVAVAGAAIAEAPLSLRALERPGAHHQGVPVLARRAAAEVGLTAVSLIPDLVKLWLELTKELVLEVPKIIAEGAGLAVGAVVRGIDAALEAITGHEIDLDRLVADAAEVMARLLAKVGEVTRWAKEQISKIGAELEQWIKDALPGDALDFLGELVGAVWDLVTAPVKLGLDLIALVPDILSRFFHGIAEGAYSSEDGFAHARTYLESCGLQDGEAVSRQDSVGVPAAVQYQIAAGHLATNNRALPDDSPGLSGYHRAVRAAEKEAIEHRKLRLQERATRAARDEQHDRVDTLNARKEGMRAQAERLSVDLAVAGRPVTDGEHPIRCTDGTVVEITLRGANAGFDGSQVAAGTERMSLYGWARLDDRDWRWRGVLVTAPPPPPRWQQWAKQQRLAELVEWKVRPLPDDVVLPGPFGLTGAPVPDGDTEGPPGGAPTQPEGLPRGPDSVVGPAMSDGRVRAPLGEAGGRFGEVLHRQVSREAVRDVGMARIPSVSAAATADPVRVNSAVMRRGTFVAVQLDPSPDHQGTSSEGNPEHATGAGGDPAAVRVGVRESPPLLPVLRDNLSTRFPLSGHSPLGDNERASPAIEVQPGLQRLIITFADGFGNNAVAHAAIAFRSTVEFDILGRPVE